MDASYESDLLSLGLLKVCETLVEKWDSEGRYEEMCGEPVLRVGGKCRKHDGSVQMRAEANLIAARTALRHKELLENEILPKAQKRVMAILDDEDAKHADLIKIWMTTMDRVGLAAVQGIIVEDISQRRPSMDVLRDLLNPTSPSSESNDAAGDSTETGADFPWPTMDESADGS